MIETLRVTMCCCRLQVEFISRGFYRLSELPKAGYVSGLKLGNKQNRDKLDCIMQMWGWLFSNY
jgi:hypothetical protein